MSDENDLYLLRRFNRSPASTLQGRREAEARMLSPRDRRMISTAQRRDRQLNLKVTAESYEAFALMARTRGMSMPDYLDYLITLDQSGGRK